MSPRAPHDRGEGESLGETLEESGGASGGAAARSRGRRSPEARRRKPARRHPDIEVARLLVKRGLIAKGPAVEALRTQKARAKAGKPRIPFLQLLVRTGVLPRERLGDAQDEIRANTYICEACDARAVVLAGSQTRAGACPRCGHEISVDPQTDPRAVPVREFQATDATQDSEATEAIRWRGGPPGLVGNAAARRLEPGAVVFEKYLLKEELGRGAMGVVFRARHLGLDKDVALKVLVPTDDNREHQVARFRREAAAVQKLRHDGIVAVHDFGGDGDLYYLTMDLVEGGESLHRALKRRDDPMPLRRRLELLIEVGHAVGHAHERGVVHRDLKPANVLISPDGHALVADFGLAKDEDDEAAELTRTHDRLGTPLFMAPEQIRRGAAQVDGRADVWALGVMLFVCVTGRYPFRSRTVMDLYLRIMKDEPDWTGTRYSAPDRPGAAWVQVDVDRAAATDRDASSTRTSERRASTLDVNEATEVDVERVRPDGSLPRTLPLGGRERRVLPLTPPPFAPPPDLPEGHVPRDLRRIIECALSKEPDDRYATAEEFARDLERFLAERPVEARTPSLLTRARRALGRKRVIARVALAATLVAVGLGALLGLQAWRRATDRRLRQQVEALWGSTGAQGGFEGYVEQLARAPDLAGRADAALYEGVALTRLLRFDEARRSLERAAERARSAGDDGLAARVAVERAHLALVSGDPRTALEQALAAHAHDLPDPRPPLYAGIAALAIGEPAALARADAVVAPVARRPGAAPQLLACAARLALARGQLDEARARLPAAEKDEWFDLTLCRAAIAMLEGDLPAAERMFARVRDDFRFRVLRDRDPEVSYYNGLGYSKLEDRAVREALLADRAAAALSPWHPGPVFYAGRVVLGGWADPQGALAELREALRRDPFHPGARELSLAILAAGPRPDLEGALALLARARELAPTDPVPVLLAAAVELRAGRAARAWALVDEAQARGVDPADPSVKLLRGGALRRAQGHERDDLRERAGDASFDVPAVAGSWLHAALRVEVARADLAAGDARGALALVRPLVEAGRTENDLAQDTAVVVAARAHAALAEREAAVAALRRLVGARHHLRPTPPDLTPEALRGFAELQPLRGDPGFQEVLEQLEARRRAPRP